jgi:hypothetical protein
MTPGPQSGAPGDAPEDAPTQGDGLWPVAPLYQVTPEPDLEHRLEQERGAMTIAAPPRRWGISPVFVIAAAVALLVLAGGRRGVARHATRRGELIVCECS